MSDVETASGAQDRCRKALGCAEEAARLLGEVDEPDVGSALAAIIEAQIAIVHAVAWLVERQGET